MVFRDFRQGITCGRCAVCRHGVVSGRLQRRGFSPGHEEFQLIRIDFLAAGPENPAHEGIDLLFQEFVFLLQFQDLLLAGGVRSGQFSFTWGHA